MNKTVYALNVFDVMGTTTPKSHIGEISDYLLRPEVSKEVSKITGVTGNMADVIKLGVGAAKRQEKDHPDFKLFLKVAEEAQGIGYQKGDLKQPLFDGVENTLRAIYAAGGRIRIFSSGRPDTTKMGLDTAGIGDIIEACHSSSEPKVGSKYAAQAYEEIARQAKVDTAAMAYVTDEGKEAEGAKEANVGKIFLFNPKDTETGAQNGVIHVNSFEQIVKQLVQA